MSAHSVPAVRGRVTAVVTVLLSAVLAAGCAIGPSGGEGHGARQFLGIRYAEAPVGPRRWAPPVPAPPPDPSARETAPGPNCPQAQPTANRQDEDCLFLNVTTPHDVQPGERLPVLVWWHGGGFVGGSGSEFDARRLAERGRVVVVTPNYRLGMLGYLGLPGLAGSGSFGFADQIQSLRWTRRYIAAYGGDPDNLTVGGESAGGASVCALSTSPALTALAVRRVIVMSGACSTRLPTNGLTIGAPARGLFVPTPAAQAAGQAAASGLGCPPADALACLRARPVTALQGQDVGFSALAWGNDLLPADPATAVRTAVPQGLPVIYGGTRDEARLFFRPSTPAFVPGSYEQLLSQAFGPYAARVAQRYPLSRYGGSAGAAWSAVVTDAGWSCPAVADQRVLAARGPTYAYEFSRADGPPGADGFPTGGAEHTSDLSLLFGPEPTDPAEQALSRVVIGYWSSFARTGVPEAPGGPGWPAVGAGGATSTLRLDPAGVTPMDTVAQHGCAFWASGG